MDKKLTDLASKELAAEKADAVKGGAKGTAPKQGSGNVSNSRKAFRVARRST